MCGGRGRGGEAGAAGKQGFVHSQPALSAALAGRQACRTASTYNHPRHSLPLTVPPSPASRSYVDFLDATGTFYSMANFMSNFIPNFVDQKRKRFPRQTTAFLVDGVSISGEGAVGSFACLP